MVDQLDLTLNDSDTSDGPSLPPSTARANSNSNFNGRGPATNYDSSRSRSASQASSVAAVQESLLGPQRTAAGNGNSQPSTSTSTSARVESEDGHTAPAKNPSSEVEEAPKAMARLWSLSFPTTTSSFVSPANFVHAIASAALQRGFRVRRHPVQQHDQMQFVVLSCRVDGCPWNVLGKILPTGGVKFYRASDNYDKPEGHTHPMTSKTVPGVPVKERKLPDRTSKGKMKATELDTNPTLPSPSSRAPERGAGSLPLSQPTQNSANRNQPTMIVSDLEKVGPWHEEEDEIVSDAESIPGDTSELANAQRAPTQLYMRRSDGRAFEEADVFATSPDGFPLLGSLWRYKQLEEVFGRLWGKDKMSTYGSRGCRENVWYQFGCRAIRAKRYSTDPPECTYLLKALKCHDPNFSDFYELVTICTDHAPHCPNYSALPASTNIHSANPTATLTKNSLTSTAKRVAPPEFETKVENTQRRRLSASSVSTTSRVFQTATVSPPTRTQSPSLAKDMKMPGSRLATSLSPAVSSSSRRPTAFDLALLPPADRHRLDINITTARLLARQKRSHRSNSRRSLATDGDDDDDDDESVEQARRNAWELDLVHILEALSPRSRLKDFASKFIQVGVTDLDELLKMLSTGAFADKDTHETLLTAGIPRLEVMFLAAGLKRVQKEFV